VRIAVHPPEARLIAGAALACVQSMEEEQEKLEVKEVKLVDECLTRAWGRWELACASSGYLPILTYADVC